MRASGHFVSSQGDVLVGEVIGGYVDQIVRTVPCHHAPSHKQVELLVDQRCAKEGCSIGECRPAWNIQEGPCWDSCFLVGFFLV